MQKNTLEQILDAFPERDFMKADGLDDAVIGAVLATDPPRLIYSMKKCIEITMEQDGMNYADAFDFLAFNTFDSWNGPQTPIWWGDMEEEAEDEDYDENDNMPDYGLN